MAVLHFCFKKSWKRLFFTFCFFVSVFKIFSIHFLHFSEAFCCRQERNLMILFLKKCSDAKQWKYYIMYCRLRIMSSHVYQIFKLIRTMTRVSYHWIFDSNVGILTHISSSVLLITGIAMFLSVIFCSTFLFSYYLLSLWRLRRISFMMKKFKGPPMLPLVGNAHLFAGCNGRGRSM